MLFANTANAPAKLLKDFAKDGMPALKAAYAEEGFYVGADQLELSRLSRVRDEVICRDCGFVAITGEECTFCSSIRWKHYSWSSQDSR